MLAPKAVYATILAALLAIAATTFAVALAQDTSATVDVRVWQSTSDPSRIYISARAEGGSWGKLGTIPLDLDSQNSRGTFRYADISLDVPLDATPEATPVPESGDQIAVTLSPSASAGRAALVHVETDHAIGYRGLQVWLEAGGAWLWRSTTRAIPEGEERELGAIIGHQWQDVTGVRVRTLSVRSLAGGSATRDEVREWQCEPPAADRHALDARYTCDTYTATEVPDLTSAEDATLWVYLVSARNQHIEAHARSGAEMVNLKVFVLYARAADHATPTGLMSSEFCLTYPSAGATERMGCGGYDGWSGMSPVPVLSEVAYVTAYETTARYLRCVRHEASTDERSVWACGAW